MRRRRPMAMAALALTVALAQGACGDDADDGGTSQGGGSDPVKVGLILNGPKEDGGWNSIWVDSAEYLEREVPGTEVTILDNIQAGAQAQQAAERLARDGNDVVVGTGGYADQDLKRAVARYDDVAFANGYGTSVEQNLAPFDLAIEEGRYLDGIVAGSMTKTNVLGEVGGFPIPISIRPLNAFYLGALSVNPDVKMKVLWVNSFYDPAKERQAAQALADQGADVLVMDTNSPALASVAKQRDLRLIGYGLKRPDAGDAWLGAFSMNWGPYLVEWVNAKQAGNFEGKLYYGGLKEGLVGSNEWGEDVPQSVLDKVEEARRKIESGELEIFSGPITDSDGEVIVEEGDALDTDAELVGCCDWYVEGIEARE
jgi:basic membrane protein A